MEINPEIIISDNPNNYTEHIYTMTVTWLPNPNRRARLGIVKCNGATLNTDWSNSGTLTISFPAERGPSQYCYFTVQHCCWWTGYNDLSNMHMRLVLDDVIELYNGSISTFDFIGFGFPSPLYGNFNLYVNSICRSQNSEININRIKDAQCNLANWYAGDPVKLSIIEGQEFASFFDPATGTDLGSFVQLANYTEFGSIYIRGKESAPPVSEYQWVTIEADINGVIETTTTYYYPDNWYIVTEAWPETLITGESNNLDISFWNDCLYSLPEETKINLEIVKGAEYGSLIDPITGEKVKILNNLDLFMGWWIGLEYVADGISPDEKDSVIIKINTTDPTIDSAYAVIYINPPPIYVYTLPEVLGVADTALIVIKKRNPDGTLEDFPAEQLFEVAATEGCINGNILVGDSLGVYFSAAQQPIYFVAADSIEEDSGYVRLRVGTDIETISTKPVTVNDHIFQKRKQNDLRITELREGYKQMLEDKRQLLNKNEAEKKEEELIEGLIIEACFTGYFSEIGYWQGDVLVKKDECDDLNPCSGFPYPEFAQYKMVPSGIIHNNPRMCDPNTIDPVTGLVNIQVGGFKALNWRLNRSQQMNAEPCFSSQSNEVHFNMILTDIETNQNSPILKPEAILEVCESNISNAGLILISDTTQFKNIITQFPEQIPILKADMDSSLSRYGATVIKYKFRQEIVAHETEHKKDYEFYLDSLKTDWLDSRVVDYTLTCTEYNSNYHPIALANAEHRIIVINYINETNIIANDRSDDLTLHQRPSIQASLADYYILLYKFENGIIL